MASDWMAHMSTTIYEVLDDLRAAATSEVDKGTKLERLMLSYLQTDPVYADQFSDVWLWQDWPGREGRHDTGIDLVAVDRISGGNVAIQVKFYAEDRKVSKDDIDLVTLTQALKEDSVEEMEGLR